MVLFEKLVKMLEKANPDYFCTYEEKSLMNVDVDVLSRSKPFAYIEEFRSGAYTKEDKFWRGKRTRVQIWFCRATDFQNSAKDRERERSRIEREIVLPFIEIYESSNAFGLPLNGNWEWATPPPRFDMNEVSIMLQFTVVEKKCDLNSGEA